MHKAGRHSGAAPRRIGASTRGTAMSEMVMVLPLLIFVLVLLLFFGRAMMRVQRTEMLVRYETWRTVADAPGPAANGANDANQLNTAFFGNNADELTLDSSGSFPNVVADSWIDGAGLYSADAENLAQAATDTLQAGRRITVDVNHDVSGTLMQPFAGGVRRTHTRLNGDWLHSNGLAYDAADDRWVPTAPRSTIYPAVRRTFLTGIDNQMEPLAAGGNTLASAIQGLYSSTPGYVGPEVNFDPD